MVNYDVVLLAEFGSDSSSSPVKCRCERFNREKFPLDFKRNVYIINTYNTEVKIWVCFVFLFVSILTVSPF